MRRRSPASERIGSAGDAHDGTDPPSARRSGARRRQTSRGERRHPSAHCLDRPERRLGQLPTRLRRRTPRFLGSWRRAAASRAGESPRRRCSTGPRLFRQARSRGAPGTACPRSRSLASSTRGRCPAWMQSRARAGDLVDAQ